MGIRQDEREEEPERDENSASFGEAAIEEEEDGRDEEITEDIAHHAAGHEFRLGRSEGEERSQDEEREERDKLGTDILLERLGDPERERDDDEDREEVDDMEEENRERTREIQSREFGEERER